MLIAELVSCIYALLMEHAGESTGTCVRVKWVICENHMVYAGESHGSSMRVT